MADLVNGKQMSDGTVVFIFIVIIMLAATAMWVFKRYRTPQGAHEAERYKEIGDKLDKLLPEQFVVADIETSGLYPEKH
jgi:hypothetical protein